MILQPSAADMIAAARDADVTRAIALSIGTALCAGLIALVLGTPFAYLLARHDFRGKKLVESAVDLPIMIPPPGHRYRPAEPGRAATTGWAASWPIWGCASWAPPPASWR